MVSVKKWRIFSNVVFGKLGPEMTLSYGLERKKSFEDNSKCEFLKIKKMGIYQRG